MKNKIKYKYKEKSSLFSWRDYHPGRIYWGQRASSVWACGWVSVCVCVCTPLNQYWACHLPFGPQLPYKESWIQWSLRPVSSSNISGFCVNIHSMPAEGCQMPASSAVFSGLVRTHYHSRLLCGWRALSALDIHSSPHVLALKKRFIFFLEIMWEGL